MYIGLGLLLSTVLAIFAWQVDKHHAWTVVGRSVLIGLGILLLAASGVGAYRQWLQAQRQREAQRGLESQVTIVRAGKLSEYWGIKLGATKEEVLYLKGSPTSEHGEPEQWEWALHFNPGYAYRVSWADGKVVAILCSGHCERIAGVGTGSSEQDVIARFRSPSIEPKMTSRGHKKVCYGERAQRVCFFLRENRVALIGIDSRWVPADEASPLK